MTLRRCLLLAGLLLVVAACSSGASAADCERIAGVRDGICLTPEEERSAAPLDVLPTISVDGEGPEMSLEDLRGQVVVVSFWASWCASCRVEQPHLNEAHELTPDDEVAFLGVNVGDSQTNAVAHLREFDVAYASLYDPENLYSGRFGGVGPRTLPSTIFLDREGRIAARLFGVVGTSEIVGLADAIAAED